MPAKPGIGPAVLTLSVHSQSVSSVIQSCPTLCDPLDHSTPGLPVDHQPPEFAQTHVHWVSDAIQPSHPLSSPSPPAFSFPASGSFQISQFLVSGGQRIGVSASTSVLPMNTQDWSPLGWTYSDVYVPVLCSPVAPPSHSPSVSKVYS